MAKKKNGKFNAYQLAALRKYGGGDFDGLKTWGEYQAAAVGDTLLEFILIELDGKEDCATIDDAIQRMRTAKADIESVIEGLNHAKHLDAVA